MRRSRIQGAAVRRLAVLLLFAPALLLASEEYIGTVVKIADGDTILIKRGTLLDGDEVKSCVTTVSVEGGAVPESFDQDIKDLFKFFTAILSLR